MAMANVAIQGTEALAGLPAQDPHHTMPLVALPSRWWKYRRHNKGFQELKEEVPAPESGGTER